MAINYTNYMIDQIKAFVAQNIVLKDVISQDNITNFYDPQNIVVPSIIVQTMQNEARNFTFKQEAVTSVSWQIQINCGVIEFAGVGTLQIEACDIVAAEIQEFLDNTLKFRRLTKTDPIPINDTNTIYAGYMRYSAKHYLIQNIIYK